jgi:hypothetical protein
MVEAAGLRRDLGDFALPFKILPMRWAAITPAT